jgi:hypothetical protein
VRESAAYTARQFIGERLDEIVTMVDLKSAEARDYDGLDVGINKFLGHHEFFPKMSSFLSLRMKRINMTRPSGIGMEEGTLVFGPNTRGVKLCSSITCSGVFPLRQL